MTHNVTSVKLSIKFAQFNWNNFSSNFKSYNKLQAIIRNKTTKNAVKYCRKNAIKYSFDHR